MQFTAADKAVLDAKFQASVRPTPAPRAEVDPNLRGDAEEYVLPEFCWLALAPIERNSAVAIEDVTWRPGWLSSEYILLVLETDQRERIESVKKPGEPKEAPGAFLRRRRTRGAPSR